MNVDKTMETNMDQLEKQLFYMEPNTGSVATGEQWMQDFHTRDDQDQDWDDWTAGGELIEVTRDFFGDWVEA